VVDTENELYFNPLLNSASWFLCAEDDLPNIGWTEWTPWGACPAPCGRTAIQVRRRCCPLGEPGIAPCRGEARETRVKYCYKFAAKVRFGALKIYCTISFLSYLQENATW